MISTKATYRIAVFLLPTILERTKQNVHIHTFWQQCKLWRKIFKKGLEYPDGVGQSSSRLNRNPAVFRLNQIGTGRCAIDSGCPQTYLAEFAYRTLREELVQYFQRRYGWHLKPNHCVTLFYTHPPRGRSYPLPSTTFHFEGASFVIGPDDLFFSLANELCMLIMFVDHAYEPSILGSFQQVNHRILFDIAARSVSFAPEHCSYN